MFRTKLNKFYGDDVVSMNGPLPAHLLGKWASATYKIYQNLFLEELYHKTTT